MLSPQATSSTTSERPNSLVERVLELRRQLSIDTPLSMHDERETLPAYNRRDWLTWSQSPGPKEPLEGK